MARRLKPHDASDRTPLAMTAGLKRALIGCPLGLVVAWLAWRAFGAHAAAETQSWMDVT